MKVQFKHLPLAMAISGICVSGSVMAFENGSEPSATLTKNVTVTKDVEYSGKVKVSGNIEVDSLGLSVINDSQKTKMNYSENQALDNNAMIDSGFSDSGTDSEGSAVMQDVTGNIGVNVSAGDNNVQANSAALSAADANLIFGSADAEIFVEQDAYLNKVDNYAGQNNATITEGSFNNAKGNIGVNVSAGNTNAQHNSFAAGVASGSMGEASVQVDQSTWGNRTYNMATLEVENEYTISLETQGNLTGTYNNLGDNDIGSGQINRLDSDLNGAVDQIGNVYPEFWSNDEGFGPNGTVHAVGSNDLIGHVDLDDDIEGHKDLNNDGGALAFGFTDDSGSSLVQDNNAENPNGGFDFREAGTMELSGTLAGSLTVVEHVFDETPENNATLMASFIGAKGNIGVNITAGSNNLQSNALAIANVNTIPVVAEPEPPQGE